VNPSDVVGRASLAVYEAKTGDHAAARDALDDVIRRAPDDPAIWSRVAQVHALARRTDEALAALVRAVDLGYARADAAAADEFAGLRGQPAFERLVGR
jgi:predicted Zn-dependent protease